MDVGERGRPVARPRCQIATDFPQKTKNRKDDEPSAVDVYRVLRAVEVSKLVARHASFFLMAFIPFLNDKTTKTHEKYPLMLVLLNM